MLALPDSKKNSLILRMTAENRIKTFHNKMKALLFDSTPKETTESI